MMSILVPALMISGACGVCVCVVQATRLRRITRERDELEYRNTVFQLALAVALTGKVPQEYRLECMSLELNAATGRWTNGGRSVFASEVARVLNSMKGMP